MQTHANQHSQNPEFLHTVTWLYIIMHNCHSYSIVVFVYIYLYSKPDTLYEDPDVQLQGNPAYGTESTATAEDVKEEETYETCFQ